MRRLPAIALATLLLAAAPALPAAAAMSVVPVPGAAAGNGSLTAPLAAFDARRWAEARAGFEQAAPAWRGPAEAYLGLMAEYGLDGAADVEAAMSHYAEARARGDMLGEMLYVLLAEDTGLGDHPPTNGGRRPLLRAPNRIYGPAAQFVSTQLGGPETHARLTLGLITKRGLGVPAHERAGLLLVNAAYASRERLALAMFGPIKLAAATTKADQARILTDLEEAARAGCCQAVVALVAAYQGRSSIPADPRKRAEWVAFGHARGWTWLGTN